jgi:hypothetical protein
MLKALKTSSYSIEIPRSLADLDRGFDKISSVEGVIGFLFKS